MVLHAVNQIFFGKEKSKNKMMKEIYLFKTKLLVMILSPVHLPNKENLEKNCENHIYDKIK